MAFNRELSTKELPLKPIKSTKKRGGMSLKRDRCSNLWYQNAMCTRFLKFVFCVDIYIFLTCGINSTACDRSIVVFKLSKNRIIYCRPNKHVTIL